jgi:DNA-binding NarL/FixJ family response regulator
MNASNPAAQLDQQVDAIKRRRPTEPVPALGPLSPRERQITALIDNGLTSKEVAFELGLSDATVRVLISRAMRKLGRPLRPRTRPAARP